MKKIIISLSMAALLIAPVFAFADMATDQLIAQLQAQIAALQVQIASIIQQQSQISSFQSQTSISQLHDGDAVRVAVDALVIRSGPSINAARIGSVARGETGVVRCALKTGDASCPAVSNGYTWWYIDWDSSASPNGWSAEGSSEGSFLAKNTSVSTQSSSFGTQSTQSTQQQSTLTQSTQQQSGGQCTFGKLYTSPYADVGSSIASTPDGGYILGGSTNLRNTGGQYYDILLSKLDANGAINWQKTYGNKTSFSRIGEIGNGEKKSALFHAVPTPDGGYLAATNISNTTFDNGNPPLITGGMGEDILLVKTGASGVVQWQKSYGRQDNGKNYQYPLALQRVSGGYVIAGQTWKDNFQSAATDSFWSTFLMKVDDQGNVVWQKRAGTQEGATFGSLAQTSDGGYLMGITSEMMTSSSQWPVGGAVIFKFDSSGNTQWTKTYTNTGGINLNGAGAMTVSSTADGGSIVSETITVSHTATDWTTQDIFLFKLDASGALQWSKMYGTPGGYEYSNAVKQTPDGGYAVLGNNRDDILFLKLNSSGDIAWQKAYSSGPVWSSVGEELPADFTITSDGGYAIVGQTDRYKITGFEKSGNESDIIAFKVDASGNIAFSASGWSAKDSALDAYTASPPREALSGGVGVADSFDLSISSLLSANASDASLSEKDLSQGTCVAGQQSSQTSTQTTQFSLNSGSLAAGTIQVLVTKDGQSWDSPPFAVNRNTPLGVYTDPLDLPQTFVNMPLGAYMVNSVTPPSGVILQNINGSSLPYSQTLSANGTITFTFNFKTVLSSSLPDLIISAGPSLNSGTLVAGQTLTFKATVKNQGNAIASGIFNNRFRVDTDNDGVIDASDPDIQALNSASNLGAGASQQVVSPGWTAVAGTYRLYACADRPGNLIAESDDVNNCAWGDTITVASTSLSSKPNIIVIMTDDQEDARVGDAASLAVMPKTKNLLVDRGIRFLNSFTDYSLCCPSRSTFMTGQFSHNHGVYSNMLPDGGYEKFKSSEGNSLPVWLKNAGYDTALIGKYLNNYWPRPDGKPIPPPGWDRWLPFQENCYFNCSYGDNGSVVNFGPLDYSTDVIANKSAEFITTRSNSQKPFFMWITPIAPHGSLGNGFPEVAPRHSGLFNSLLLPKPPSFNEADVSDKPFNIRNRSSFDQVTIDRIATAFRARQESYLAVDDLVEKIVSALGVAGKLENTVIIFTSDNGWMQGEHRIKLGKRIMYEESARVPLIMEGPGISAGQTRTQLVSNVDLAATILDFAGGTPGRVLDGKSLIPLFSNSTIPWRSALLMQGVYGNEVLKPGRYTAVRTNKFLYAKHIYSDGSESENELYDLSTDPYELASSHGNSSYASVMAALQNILTRLQTCAGLSCWATDSEPSQSVLPDLIISTHPSLNSGSLVAGQTLTFKATIKNQGNADALGTFNNRFRIDLNNDGVIDASDPDIQALNSASNLAAGASQQVVSPGWTAVAGTYRLYACADRPGNLIAESDDVNNCAWGDTIMIAPAPSKIFSASKDFSSTQGQNGWWYVYNFAGAQMTYDVANNRWRGNDANDPYVLLWGNGGHPGVTYNAVRRWIAPKSGSIRITGTAADGNAGCGTDGVNVKIRKVPDASNTSSTTVATVLWAQAIQKDDTVGYQFDQSTTVAQGDAIDFVINRGIDNTCDSTVFDPTIVFLPSLLSSAESVDNKDVASMLISLASIKIQLDEIAQKIQLLFGR